MRAPETAARQALAWLLLAAVLGAVSVLLWASADPGRILEDTLQHIGVARHLLHGEGLKSSLLYYEAQYVPGTLPVPQTVWPPGSAALIASLGAAGVDPEAAALFIGWLSVVVAALLVFAIVRDASGSITLAATASAFWATSFSVWFGAAIAASEPPFVAFLLAATWALQRALHEPQRAVRWLLAAGGASAAAILIRYTGVLFVAAASAALLWQQRDRIGAAIGQIVAFAAIPAATTLALFARNYVLTGNLTGGQFGVTQGVAPLRAVSRAWWSMLEVLSLPARGGIGLVAQAGLAALLLCAVWFTLRALPGPALRHRPVQERLRDGLIVTCASVCAGTLAVHGLWAMTTSEWMLDSRYLEPLWPFLCMLLAMAAAACAARLGALRWIPAVAALVFLGFAALQWAQWRDVWSGYASIKNRVAVAAALSSVVDGTTVREWLAAHPQAGPVLANLEHTVHVQLDRPVLGLADARYTSRVWDEPEVAKLMRRYGACVVLFLPSRFPINRDNARNLAFFQALADGRRPQWLTPLLRSPQADVYVVNDRDTCSKALP